jgi:hypothetical protein
LLPGGVIVSKARTGRTSTLPIVLLGFVCVCGGRSVVFAQQPGDVRIGRFAVDVHGVTGSYGPTAQQAASLGYADSDLPGRGFGWDVGGQVYFLKVGTTTFGAGGNLVRTSGNSNPKDADGASTGNKASTQFRSFATQVTANFGRRRGWSYLSAGYGVSTFGVWNSSEPAPTNLPHRNTINFGFGARWFQKEHVAFSFDLRFYKLAAQAATETAPSDAKQTRVVIGAGVSFR